MKAKQITVPHNITNHKVESAGPGSYSKRSHANLLHHTYPGLIKHPPDECVSPPSQ
jgi:hypothetical protein